VHDRDAWNALDVTTRNGSSAAAPCSTSSSDPARRSLLGDTGHGCNPGLSAVQSSDRCPDGAWHPTI